jgi:hypothetical protein
MASRYRPRYRLATRSADDAWPIKPGCQVYAAGIMPLPNVTSSNKVTK